MTVYVDDFQVSARVGELRGRWSHLIADSQEELHAFAARIGLRRSWFQDPTVSGTPQAKPGTRAAERWHYDVPESKRQHAIRLGAVPVPWRELPGLINHRIDHGTCRPAPQEANLAERLVQVAHTALARRLGGYAEPGDTWDTEARDTVVVVLRELENSGVFDPEDSAVFNRLAQKITEAQR